MPKFTPKLVEINNLTYILVSSGFALETCFKVLACLTLRLLLSDRTAVGLLLRQAAAWSHSDSSDLTGQRTKPVRVPNILHPAAGGVSESDSK